MMKKNKNIDTDSNLKEENVSFFEKIKTDKKYSAKVQLIGFGVFIGALVIYVNIASLGSSGMTSNSLGDLDTQIGDEETNDDTTNLLEQLDDNYHYDISVNVQMNSENEQEEEDVTKIRYVGKSFENQMEITREDTLGSSLYYKVDNRYYSKSNETMDLAFEEDIYSVVDSEYIELDGILELIDKASLDHVTDYSSGKKEYVYHLKVRDVVVSYKLEDVIEIHIVEENATLNIEVDYTSLLRVVDENIVYCKLEATITEVGQVEAFLVLNDDADEDNENSNGIENSVNSNDNVDDISLE